MFSVIIDNQISEEEIEFLTKGEDPYDDNVVRKLYHKNLKLLPVTEGPDGCRYYTKVIIYFIFFLFNHIMCINFLPFWLIFIGV